VSNSLAKITSLPALFYGQRLY